MRFTSGAELLYQHLNFWPVTRDQLSDSSPIISSSDETSHFRPNPVVPLFD